MMHPSASVTVVLLAACLCLSPAAITARDLLQGPAPESAPEVTAADILNFALNLEYLEGEFYSWAAFGKPLPADLRGGGPASTGGQKANLTAPIQAIANEIATDEINHVRFLRAALGSAAVPIPKLDIGPAFAAAADAALNQTLAPPFSPYVNDVLFLHGAFIFEDVGVTAYHGAAPVLAMTPGGASYLGPAAGILAVEAYHAGIIRTKLSEIQNQLVLPYGVPVATIVNDISALRAKLSGAADDQGITLNGTQNLVPTNDTTSIVFARTPRQVLNIVYFMPNAAKGGFFPNGLNGAIKA